MLRNILKLAGLKRIFALLMAVTLWLFYLIGKRLLQQDDIWVIQQNQNETGDKNQSGQTCQQNMAAANIAGFNSFPERIKDFLYYQHYRHFPVLLDNPDKCGGANWTNEVFLLLVIKSSPGNYERREVLRKTWAEEKQMDGLWVRRIFASGTTGDGFEKTRMNTLLELEQQEHGDILQWDFKDTLLNLTLKQTLFLEWHSKNCPRASFLLIGDDDVFVHTENIVEYLKSLNDTHGSRHLFTGHLVGGGPIRNPQSKYYVPVQVYQSNHFPLYCSGGGYLLSRFTASVIHGVSQSIPNFPIDDVYMGMCLAKAGLKPSFHAGVKPHGVGVSSKKVHKLDPCFYKDILVVHRFLPPQIYLMWHQVHDPDLKCGP